MATYLLAASPIQGHVMPMVAIAADLVNRGHQVRVLTGARFADRVAAVGAAHLALPPAADYDDRDPDAAFPGRSAERGLGRLRFDVDKIFIDPIPHQAAAVASALAADPADALLVEGAFLGAVPLILRPRSQRPPVVGCGVLPLPLSSVDTAPFGLAVLPATTAAGRLRNRALYVLMQRVLFAGQQRHFRSVVRNLGCPPPPAFLLDTVPRLADRFLQLTTPSFEYPRRDAPPGLAFAGPVLPASDGTAHLPDWWHELDGRPVVHVTQGTIDNGDLDRLIGPVLRGLAQEPVLVVVSTGGRPAAAVPGPLPANARVAEFLPYDRLLPRTDVMVTNGGYGGVQYALANGVPLVVAGDTEDKPEVASRVRWAGVGIDLRCAAPKADAVRRAVRTVLDDPRYRLRAADIRAEMAAYRSFEAIAQALHDAASAPATGGR